MAGKQITIWVTKKQHDRLQTLSQEKRRGIGSLVREALYRDPAMYPTTVYPRPSEEGLDLTKLD